MTVGQARLPPLLPYLKEIRVLVNHTTNFSDAFLAISSTVELIEFSQPVVAASAFLTPFITTVLQRCSSIREFIIQGHTLIDLRFASHFKSLRRLDLKLTNTHLTPQFFADLGGLGDLNKISIHVGASMPAPGDPSNLLLSKKNFKSLRHLDVLGSIRLVSRLLGFMNLRNLTSFRLLEEANDNGNAKPYWNQCFQHISVSNKLKELEIVQHARNGIFEAKWMSSLSNLRRLESLIIRNASCRISEGDIPSLLRSYPLLKTLILPESWRTAEHAEPNNIIPIHSLVDVVTLCPLLEEIRIPISGTFYLAQAKIEQTLESRTFKMNKGLQRHSESLRKLALSSQFGALQNEDVALLARVIYRMYPNLESLEGTGRHRDRECWPHVWVVYKAIQSEVRTSKAA